MLTKKQITEIREHLEKAQNPIFFFDNDGDGLCSFLLLQRYIGRGKGVAMKSADAGNYFKKVMELNADYIFILDKPVVSEKFFEEVRQVNLPVVWIDHHENSNIPDFVNYYNPLLNKGKTNEPVTELCYRIAGRKQDLWIAVVGCISDHFVPDFYFEFKEKYPDLAMDSENVKEIYFKSQIGKIGKIFNAGLKDRTTNVVIMLKFLMKVKTPYEVLEESSYNQTMHKKFKEINEKYERLLEKAKSQKNDEGVLFFQYGGELSISSDLANGLRYEFPEKIIVVIYVSGDKVNISVRGKNVREIVLEVIKDLEGATGGGHEKAVGVRVKVKDLEKFKAKLLNIVNLKNS
ncbi:hypothetical protein KAT80_01465 [Candidatus Pacearchaeota archaeon]|nr:hypothetical protein [Candidatus Pacearchaeota archaeon]